MWTTDTNWSPSAVSWAVNGQSGNVNTQDVFEKYWLWEINSENKIDLETII